MCFVVTAKLGVKVERPMKINLSVDKVEQIQGFLCDVVVSSGQRSDEGADSTTSQSRGEPATRETTPTKSRGEPLTKDGTTTKSKHGVHGE